MLERVVYVGGTGRSGTTAVGRGLAASEGAVWAGELVWLPRDLDEDRRCSCGELASRCPFWREVRGRLGWSDVELRHRREDIWRDRHRGFPRALRTGAADRASLEAVASVAGASCVIDTSKYAARALRLHRAHHRLDLLWVRRDPRGLASSLLRDREGARRFSAPEAVMYDAVVERSWRAVARRLPVEQIPIEPLWASGAQGLLDLARRLGLPAPEVGSASEWTGGAHALTAHHEVARDTQWRPPTEAAPGVRASAAGWVMSRVRGRRQP